MIDYAIFIDAHIRAGALHQPTLREYTFRHGTYPEISALYLFEQIKLAAAVIDANASYRLGDLFELCGVQRSHLKITMR